MLWYLIRTMKKMIALFSVVAVAFALQAGEAACSKDKAACDKKKAAGCPAKAEVKGCCPSKGDCSAKVAKADGAKKPVKSPKAAGEAK